MAGRDFESHGTGEQFESARGDSAEQFDRTADKSFVGDVHRSGGGFDGRRKDLFASSSSDGKSRGQAGRSVTADRPGGKEGFKSSESGASAGGVSAGSAKTSMAQRAQSAGKNAAAAAVLGGVRSGVGGDGDNEEVMPDDAANAWRSASRAKRAHDARAAAKADGTTAHPEAPAQEAASTEAAAAPQEAARPAAQGGLFSSQGGTLVGDGSLTGTSMVKVDVANSAASMNPHGITGQAARQASSAGAKAGMAKSAAPAAPAAQTAQAKEAARETMLAAQRASNVRTAMKASRLGRSTEWVAGKATGAAARAKAAFAGKTAVAGVAKAGGGGAAVAIGGIGGSILLALAIVFGLVGFVLFAGGGSQDDSDVGSLTGVAAEVASFFKEQGWSNVSIAALLGNMQQECGMDPACETDGIAYGLLQWEARTSDGGPGRFVDLQNFAASKGKDWTDVRTQCEFILQEAPGVFDVYSSMHYVYPTGAVAGLGERMSLDEWLSITDVGWATEAWERVYTRASLPMMEQRKSYAQQFLQQLNTPSANGGFMGATDLSDATDAQKSMYAFAVANNTYGLAGGNCEAWVEHVYQSAGHAYPYMCCATGAWNAWGVSTSMDNIPIGACVYGYSAGGAGGGCHSDYGHVGIYVGNGVVASLRYTGYVSYDPIDLWVSIFGWKGWGWCGGTSLA